MGYLIRYLIHGLVFAAILIVGSGHTNWARAWIYIGFVLGCQVATSILLMRVSPDLLVERSRMQKGTKWWDKYIVLFAAVLGPLLMCAAAAWDVRTNWPPLVPVMWSVFAFVLVGLSSVLTAWAMVSNRFFSATVRIQSDRGHQVVNSGPYRFVRHPGYVGMIVFMAASPTALGSPLALLPALFAVGLFILRTALEDRTLMNELPGYREYAGRVRYRLAPGLW